MSLLIIDQTQKERWGRQDMLMEAWSRLEPEERGEK